MLEISGASLEEAEEIAECMRNAYSDEIFKYDDKNKVNNHPTVDKVKYHIAHDIFYKIVLDDIIIGGVFITEEGVQAVSIQDFCIAPPYQNKGYGKFVLKELERIHCDIKKWELTTPVYSVGNQHLYEKQGFKRVKVDDYGGTLCVFYEKFLS